MAGLGAWSEGCGKRGQGLRLLGHRVPMDIEPWPEELLGRPFTVAEAKHVGVTYARLRRVGLDRPTTGVRRLTTEGSFVERARAIQVAMPTESAFSHETALQLWGIDLPWTMQEGAPLHVMTLTDVNQVRRGGVQGHRGLESRERKVRHGIRVIGLVDTWIDMGERVRDLRLGRDEVVALGDQVLNKLSGLSGNDDFHRRHVLAMLGHTGPGSKEDIEARARVVSAELLRRLETRVRPRGKRLLLEAHPLMRVAVRSVMETRARLMFRDAGFPEPLVNEQVFADDGTWLAEGDLVWPGHRVVGEYQGEHHADRGRRSLDSVRGHSLHEERWTMHELWAEDVFDRQRRQSLLRRLARDMKLELADLEIGWAA